MKQAVAVLSVSEARKEVLVCVYAGFCKQNDIPFQGLYMQLEGVVMGYALLMALPNEYNLNALRKHFWDKERGRRRRTRCDRVRGSVHLSCCVP